MITPVSDEGSLLQRIIDSPLAAMVIAFAAVMIPAGLIAGLFEVALPSTPTFAVLAEVAVAGTMIASYKIVVRHLGARQHDDLSGPNAARQLALGIAVGAVVFGLIVAVAAAAGVYRVSGVGDTGNLYVSLIRDGLFPAITEEMIYRGILFRWIEDFAGSWPALVLSSALFGASHMENPNADLISTVGIMLEGGILLGAAYMLTRRLWFPMGIHAAWNLTQGEVFDIPVSGNDAHGLVEAQLHGPALLTGRGFGLEGSLIGITIGTVAGLVILLFAIHRRKLIAPVWVRHRKFSENPPQN